MSEVKKWYIGVYGGEAQARPCSPAEFEIINEREGRYFVLEEDFDRVAAERDALQQRLTAADELLDSTKAELAWQESDNAELRKRVDVLEGLLRSVIESGALTLAIPSGEEIEADICAELKPASRAPGLQRETDARAAGKDFCGACGDGCGSCQVAEESPQVTP